MGPNNQRPQGMTWASLKHHTALQPLMVIMAGGITFVALYCGRLASKTTDINWTKAKDLGDHMVTTITGDSNGSTLTATTTPISRIGFLDTGTRPLPQSPLVTPSLPQSELIPPSGARDWIYL